jgi:hypothetical protein
MYFWPALKALVAADAPEFDHAYTLYRFASCSHHGVLWGSFSPALVEACRLAQMSEGLVEVPAEATPSWQHTHLVLLDAREGDLERRLEGALATSDRYLIVLGGTDEAWLTSHPEWMVLERWSQPSILHIYCRRFAEQRRWKRETVTMG